MAALIDPGSGSLPPGQPPYNVQPKDWAVHLGQRVIDWAIRETPQNVATVQNTINALDQLARQG